MTTAPKGLRRLHSYFSQAIANALAPAPQESKRKASPPRARPSVECLESRDMLSVSPLLPATFDLVGAETAHHGVLTASAPTAPRFTTTAVSSSQINLTWTAVSGATSYQIDEWVNNAWKQVGSVGAATTSFAATGLSAGTTYYFDLGASNSAGTTWASYQSAVTSAAKLTAPAAPTFTTTAVSTTQINLTWTTVSGATGYQIDEWVNNAWKQVGSVGAATTSFAVTGLSAGTSYYFDLAASNSAGTTWANYQSATTLQSGGTTLNEPTAAYGYSAVSGTLFGANGPSYLDVQQGQEGDCWLLSSLAAVAARNPSLIESMFTYKGTEVENGATVGLYSVRLYSTNGTAEYITVDTELPDGGKYYDMPENGVLWVALAEKAYAEANGAGYVTTQEVGSDSYNALNGGDPAWALHAITGQSANDFAINPTNLAAAWNAGDYIVIATGATTANSAIVSDHAYAVVGYTASSSTPFEVYNPWGTVQASEAHVYGLFNASAATLSQNFVEQTFVSDLAEQGGAQPGFDFSGAAGVTWSSGAYDSHPGGALFPTDASYLSSVRGLGESYGVGDATQPTDRSHGSHTGDSFGETGDLARAPGASDGYEVSGVFHGDGADLLFSLNHRSGGVTWKGLARG
jgi:hypothetical protein